MKYAKHTKEEKRPITASITLDAYDELEYLSRSLDISKGAVIEMAIQEIYKSYTNNPGL